MHFVPCCDAFNLMNITKDEARILAAALSSFKWDLDETGHIDGLSSKIDSLEIKLEKFGKDKRRTGRTSQDDWSDLMKRFAS